MGVGEGEDECGRVVLEFARRVDRIGSESPKKETLFRLDDGEGGALTVTFRVKILASESIPECFVSIRCILDPLSPPHASPKKEQKQNKDIKRIKTKREEKKNKMRIEREYTLRLCKGERSGAQGSIV